MPERKIHMKKAILAVLSVAVLLAIMIVPAVAGKSWFGGTKEQQPEEGTGSPPPSWDTQDGGDLPENTPEIPGDTEDIQLPWADAEGAGEISVSSMTSSAASLTANTGTASVITMNSSNSKVEIEKPGTYIITGYCQNGNIKVKKGIPGVVLILRDLTLTSTEGAAVSCGKQSVVKIVIEGNVTLCDAEDPDDEYSSDSEIADAFDGAAIKVRDGADVCITGDGTLTIDAASCKNGIKSGDDPSTVLVIDGDLTINISADNDAINAAYDLSILSGTLNITAGDDAIHADRILTVGSYTGEGPEISIERCTEGLEGAVVDLFGGKGTINATDDALNATDKNKVYSGELTVAINITGGEWTIYSRGDGLDSNGDINITGGYTEINSSYNGGEAGIDYEGSFYVADGTLNNNGGISFDSGTGGMPGNGMGPGGNRPDGGGSPGGGGQGGDGGNFPGDGGNFPGDSGNKPGERPGGSGGGFPGGGPGNPGGGSGGPGGGQPVPPGGQNADSGFSPDPDM